VYQLTETSMRKALEELCARDAMLAGLYRQYGLPPLWMRPQSFATLIHIIFEQKVSLGSASAVMDRVRSICPVMEPSEFLQVPELALRQAGVSASKLSYCRSLAQTLDSGELRLTELCRLADDEVIHTLTRIRGIGPWTAGVYLMMALRRPDAWASGDRALAVSYAESTGSQAVPAYARLDEAASMWKPHRGTAARLLWHAYLQRRQRDA